MSERDTPLEDPALPPLGRRRSFVARPGAAPVGDSIVTASSPSRTPEETAPEVAAEDDIPVLTEVVDVAELAEPAGPAPIAGPSLDETVREALHDLTPALTQRIVDDLAAVLPQALEEIVARALRDAREALLSPPEKDGSV